MNKLRVPITQRTPRKINTWPEDLTPLCTTHSCWGSTLQPSYPPIPSLDPLRCGFRSRHVSWRDAGGHPPFSPGPLLSTTPRRAASS
ncbi:hypothetical protein SKAU_G00073540 [Synaphobranchus kaupii]|uniref:Uncharacterized protein n=1 Tax=Synaphobranchus kaupii TaxID=118154 RepID=A0A9Q1G782_SYNKA|nr:hypothetical protein SKAU_G00073540 [Synaphobranchus kaupii]